MGCETYREDFASDPAYVQQGGDVWLAVGLAEAIGGVRVKPRLAHAELLVELVLDEPLRKANACRVQSAFPEVS